MLHCLYNCVPVSSSMFTLSTFLSCFFYLVLSLFLFALSLSLYLSPSFPPLGTFVSEALLLLSQLEILQVENASLGPTAHWVPVTCFYARLALSAP